MFVEKFELIIELLLYRTSRYGSMEYCTSCRPAGHLIAPCITWSLILNSCTQRFADSFLNQTFHVQVALYSNFETSKADARLQVGTNKDEPNITQSRYRYNCTSASDEKNGTLFRIPPRQFDPTDALDRIPRN
jgi:hypothetical protein